MKLKVSKKIDGKWLGLGNVKENQFGNPALGLHCTEAFKKLVNDTETGGWLNLSLFDDNKEKTHE